MRILKNVFLVVIVATASYFFSYLFGELYGIFFVIGGFVDMTSLIGLPLAYIFFLILIFTACGGTKKYWWMGIGSIPGLAFGWAFFSYRIYLAVILGFLGWLVGFGIQKLLALKSSAYPA